MPRRRSNSHPARRLSDRPSRTPAGWQPRPRQSRSRPPGGSTRSARRLRSSSRGSRTRCCRPRSRGPRRAARGGAGTCGAGALAVRTRGVARFAHRQRRSTPAQPNRQRSQRARACRQRSARCRRCRARPRCADTRHEVGGKMERISYFQFPLLLQTQHARKDHRRTLCGDYDHTILTASHP